MLISIGLNCNELIEFRLVDQWAVFSEIWSRAPNKRESRLKVRGKKNIMEERGMGERESKNNLGEQRLLRVQGQQQLRDEISILISFKTSSFPLKFSVEAESNFRKIWGRDEPDQIVVFSSRPLQCPQTK